jgi:DNA-binding NarL/FixJ family response regulator
MLKTGSEPSRPKKRALVVEDQTTFRELLCELLSTEAGYEVEASASGAQARACLEKARFDLVLLDLVLPDMHGFELLAQLASAGSRVLVLTAQARPAVVKDALARGVHAVVTKGAPLRELREAIARVSSGGIYYSAETSRLLREAAVYPERDEQLTERQREVLRAVASGLSTKEIATQLSLSEKTVANHRARIMERLGVHDVAGMTRYAIALGLVDSET